MWGIAALLVIATVSASGAAVTVWVYRCSAGLLLALAIRMSLTGARTPVVGSRPARRCSRPRRSCC